MASWDQLQFLIGSWRSPLSGEPGQGTGWATFSHDLDQKVIIRRSRMEFTAMPGQEKGQVHDDLLIIYQQPAETHFRAIYFDNEGHIINYLLSFPDKQAAVILESETDGKSPRARLVYEAMDVDTLVVEFFVAAPGGELLSHVKGITERERA